MHQTKTIDINGALVKIDLGCIELVTLFNKFGLKTKYSCQGDYLKNNFIIVFDKSVTDEQMELFLSKFKNNCGHSPILGKFSKWCRLIDNTITYNWIFYYRKCNECRSYL